jgi:hypothetical protein
LAAQLNIIPLLRGRITDQSLSPEPREVQEIRNLMPKRLDIGDHVIDFDSGQREIGHRTMRMRKERAQLIPGETDGTKARWPLLNRRRARAIDHVTISAPLLC